MKAILKYAVAILVVLIGLWIFGTSSSFKTCKTEQAASNAEERKENPPPFILAAADSAAICARCAGHVIYEYRDAAIAFATVLIALFTYTLYQATKGLVEAAAIQSADMKRSIGAAEIAAKAATDAATIATKQFAAGFKPWLVAKISGPYLARENDATPLGPDEKRRVSIEACVEIENISDMAATIIRSHVRAEGDGIDGALAEDVFEILTKGGRFFPLRHFQNAEHPVTNVQFGSFFMTEQYRRQIMQRPPPIIGQIEYLDPLGKRRILGFAFQPATLYRTLGFKRYGGTEYNYDRTA